MRKENLLTEFNPDRDKALEDLFKDMEDPSITDVNLPSKGKFYKSYNGVTLTPLEFEDEQKILLSKKKINVVREILRKCVKGIDVDSLLPMDELYLLMKVREISYGKNYKFEIPCNSCGNVTKVTLDLSNSIKINYVPEELEDPRELVLPLLNKKVKVRFPRAYDQPFLNNFSEDPISTIYRFVISIEGNEDPVFISKALKRMRMPDIKAILYEVNRNDLGVDPRFNFECAHCGANSLMGLPLDANFFSVI